MQRWIVLLVISAVFAGCADPETDPDAESDLDDGTDEGGDDGGPNLNGTEGNVTALVAVMVPSVTNGSAPLDVGFDLSAEGAGANVTWTLSSGEDELANGTSLPAQANQTFGAGNHTILFAVTSGNRTASANATIVVAEVASQPMPETVHWEFGPTAGCMEDLESTCVAFDEGPGGEGPDGHWIALGPAYYGRGLTSTIDKGDVAGSGEWPFYDSDCFFTDADGNVVADGHNSGEECMVAAIPDGAEWLFIYPYLTPALSMTVDVVV